MFKKNRRHLQIPLTSHVDELPDKLRKRLENSWAGVFYREVFSRLHEAPSLLDRAFEQVTDEQMAAFRLKAGKQRMDSTLVASNIRQMGRVQLLVEVLERGQRMLNEGDQERYAAAFAPA